MNDLTPPDLWDKEISRLHRRIEKLPTQEKLIVFYGSSSIRLWVNIKKDLDPLNVLNLGFGGSSYSWCLHYFEELFQNITPERIVLYAGDNDLSNGATPHMVLEDIKKLLLAIAEKYGNIKTSIISIKPSIERVDMIPIINNTNSLIRNLMENQLGQQYIDIHDHMLDGMGQPLKDLFLSDGLHLNKNGYKVWKKVIETALKE